MAAPTGISLVNLMLTPPRALVSLSLGAGDDGRGSELRLKRRDNRIAEPKKKGKTKTKKNRGRGLTRRRVLRDAMKGRERDDGPLKVASSRNKPVQSSRCQTCTHTNKTTRPPGRRYQQARSLHGMRVRLRIPGPQPTSRDTSEGQAELGSGSPRTTAPTRDACP